MRKAFSIHSDFYAELWRLGSAKCGEVVIALINWAEETTPPKLADDCAMLFRLMTQQIERIAIVNAENGKKGGRGHKSEKRGQSEPAKIKPTAPASYTVTVTDSIYDNGGCAGAQETTVEDLFSRYFGTAPTPAERETCDTLSSMCGSELLEHAFFIAGRADEKNLGYVIGIINKWKERGVKDMGDVADDDLRHECNRKNRK